MDVAGAFEQTFHVVLVQGNQKHDYSTKAHSENLQKKDKKL